MQELTMIEVQEVSGAIKPSVGLAAVGSALMVVAAITAEVPPVGGFFALGGTILGAAGALARCFE